MEYISKKEFAQLKGKDVTIKKVFGPYRKGWNEAKKRFETFKSGSEDMIVWENGEETVVDDKMDYKIHKKKYDVVITLASPTKMKVNQWNKDKQESEVVTVESEEYTVQEISANMLGDMMACGVAFGNIPTDDQDRRVFDWEESFIADLEGATIKFDTKKEDWEINGKSGQYDAFTFVSVSGTAPAKAAPVQSSYEDDLPF